eukprot:GHVP01026743.1.p1 GENE.GHVP01026743.1~~GHVP01026743.1.p1  ORF type:complete len:236 (-),score=61.98 GHVP01026743.1:237-944(-)
MIEGKMTNNLYKTERCPRTGRVFIFEDQSIEMENKIRSPFGKEVSSDMEYNEKFEIRLNEAMDFYTSMYYENGIQTSYVNKEEASNSINVLIIIQSNYDVKNPIIKEESQPEVNSPKDFLANVLSRKGPFILKKNKNGNSDIIKNGNWLSIHRIEVYKDEGKYNIESEFIISLMGHENDKDAEVILEIKELKVKNNSQINDVMFIGKFIEEAENRIRKSMADVYLNGSNCFSKGP